MRSANRLRPSPSRFRYNTLPTDREIAGRRARSDTRDSPVTHDDLVLQGRRRIEQNKMLRLVIPILILARDDAGGLVQLESHGRHSQRSQGTVAPLQS